MKTSAYLPVGTAGNYETKRINKGDVLLLATGEKVTFTEMKRVKFHAIMNGGGIQVPTWRNRHNETPYIKEVVGRDESVMTVSADIQAFTAGELFALEGHKETFMFDTLDYKRGKEIIKAIDIATGKPWSIGTQGFTYVKIDIEELKSKL